MSSCARGASISKVPSNPVLKRRVIAGWKILYDKSVCGDAVFGQVERFARSGNSPDDWIMIESSGDTRVWKFPGGDGWYVLKEYLKKDVREAVRSLLRGSRARNGWVHGRELSRNGFLTPDFVLFGEKSIGVLIRDSFLVTGFIQAQGVYTLVKRHFVEPHTSAEIHAKRLFIKSFGHFIGRLHTKGFFHGDLRLDNIMVRGWKTGKFEFFLIDNERNKYFSGGIPDKCRVKNLVQLNMIVLPQITFSDRMRFFKSYLIENPGLLGKEKVLARTVFLKTRKRLQKKFPRLWEKDAR